MILPCISVRQPWAFAIVNLGKNIENREWRYPPRYRGPLLLHASKGLTRAEYDDSIDFGMADDLIAEHVGELPGSTARRFPRFEDIERGGIVGACEFYDVGEPLSESLGWSQGGAMRFKLRKQSPLPFRPLRGMLGLFKVEITPSEEQTLRTAGLIP